MRAFLGCLAIIALFPTHAHAQTIVSYTLTIYVRATTTIVGTPTVIPVSAFSCNLPQVSFVSALNPTKIVLNDPVNTGRDCIYTDSGTGPLSTLTFTIGYEATLIATDTLGGVSLESARSNPFYSTIGAQACPGYTQGSPLLFWTGGVWSPVVLCQAF